MPEAQFSSFSQPLFRTFYKIIWIVRGFLLVYKCVFIALWSTKMAWAMWLTASELWEFIVSASYIVFLFVKTKNNFIKEIKHVFRAFIACWKPRQSLWEFSSRWKHSTASRVITDLLSNSPKRTPWFSAGYEGTKKMFYFLINLLWGRAVYLRRCIKNFQAGLILINYLHYSNHIV